jgi:hypothetical protein
MSRGKKRLREVYALLKQHELEIVEERANKHRVITVRNKNGVESQLTVGSSPSDYRATRNLAKIMRDAQEKTQ